MKNVKKKIKNNLVKSLIIVALMILVFGASWILTCGMVKLITMCFEIRFTWRAATGVWLILLLLGSMLGGTKLGSNNSGN